MVLNFISQQMRISEIKIYRSSMNKIFLIFLAVPLIFGSCTRTANKTGQMLTYPPITTDIEIGEEVRGEGTRASLLGIIRWGDPGRATFESRKQERDLGGLVGGVVKQSMQSAVYDALKGQPDYFIVDPHFHTVEHNFLVFRTATTEVVGRKAKNSNYRQVKRFNTDNSETLLLDDAPQTVTIERSGQAPTKLTTSSHIKPYVMDSVRIYDASKDTDIKEVQVVDYAKGNYSRSNATRTQDYRSSVDTLNQNYQVRDASYKSLAERLRDLNRRLNDYTKQ